MVDLTGQYSKIKKEIDHSIIDTIEKGQYINGPQVELFTNKLKEFIHCDFVIPCGNGTDAIQIALMALDLEKGDEVICPAFTYVATAEVISLLGLVPVMADVDPKSFNITAEIIEPLITPKTKAIIPVHLFGQSCDMEGIMKIAESYNLYIIEDNAQAIGAKYTFSDGTKKYTGTIGHIGTTSFFPSKNLGCYGDGGAIFTNNSELAQKMRMIANHGQLKKYYHKIIGCNSRLDSIQACILNIKLKYLEEYTANRNIAADAYDNGFKNISDLIIPYRQPNSTHVFHQYTLKVNPKKREGLINYLNINNIPAMIYYPVPLYKQEAFKGIVKDPTPIENVENLTKSVLSLPIHSELETLNQEKIIETVNNFFH